MKRARLPGTVVAVLALAACAPDPVAPDPVTPGQGLSSSAHDDPELWQPVRSDRRSAGEAAGEWREALELDLPDEVVLDGHGLVVAGGAFAHDGVCVSLVARALFAVGREAEAFALLERSDVAVGAEHVDVARARLMIERDELDSALHLLTPRAPPGSETADDDDAPTLHPLVPECWLVHGRAFARRGELARAAPYLARFAELAPRHPETAAALHLLVEHALSVGDEERALALEQRAAELGRWHAFYNARRLQVREDPDAPLPRLGLARLWLAADENARAREVLRELTRRHPEFARGWAALGEAHQRIGDLDYAGEAWERALELDPELVETRLNRARLALLDERPDDARRDLEHLVNGPHANDANLAPAHLELARLLRDAGEADAARVRYARYRELGGTEGLE